MRRFPRLREPLAGVFSCPNVISDAGILTFPGEYIQLIPFETTQILLIKREENKDETLIPANFPKGEDAKLRGLKRKPWQPSRQKFHL